MKVFKILISSLVVALLGGSASAGVVSSSADCNGTGPTGLTGAFTCGDAARHNLDNAEIFINTDVVGDDDFYSLGLGGSLVLQFDPVVKTATMIIEITNTGPLSDHQEAVEVFGSNDGVNFISLGSADNQGGIDDGPRGTTTTIAFAGYFEYLGFRDVSESTFAGTASTDGFDIDAISVSTVPLPAAGLMLLGGLVGMGAMRRRKQS